MQPSNKTYYFLGIVAKTVLPSGQICLALHLYFSDAYKVFTESINIKTASNKTKMWYINFP